MGVMGRAGQGQESGRSVEQEGNARPDLCAWRWGALRPGGRLPRPRVAQNEQSVGFPDLEWPHLNLGSRLGPSKAPAAAFFFFF